MRDPEFDVMAKPQPRGRVTTAGDGSGRERSWLRGLLYLVLALNGLFLARVVMAVAGGMLVRDSDWAPIGVSLLVATTALAGLAASARG